VAEVRFLGDLAAGAFRIEPVHPADWLRIAELVARYRHLPLGTTDAAAVVCAERLGITEVATVDRRHLGVVRPATQRRSPCSRDRAVTPGGPPRSRRR
jgi:predicted nucleic acid-binding protein